MKNKKRLAIILLLTGCISIAAIPLNEARAITVYDPTNHVQNILTALRTLKSNLNEASMISNQVQSLANELENLKKLEFSVVDDFSNQMNELFEVTGSINGLMQDFASLQSEFENLYPDFGKDTGIDSAELARKANEWLQMSRNTVLGASQTGAKVLENLPRSQAQLTELVGASQGAAGILQASQAGNQISATIAGNLQTLNAQIATYSQAHMSYLMMQQSARGAAAARSRDAMKDWGKRKKTVTVPLAGL